MIRERALKISLVGVGLLFVALIYPLATLHDETLQMMLSVYVTLGVFLLIASRNPPAHRSLIAFTAWSSFAHGAVMALQSLRDIDERMHLLIGTTVLVIVGIALIALAPRKTSAATS